MKNILTFVIPVRHPENSRDWATLKRNLAQTVKSIAAQDHDGWKAIIVANTGSDLPDLPAGFEVVHVDYPPNPMFDQGSNELEAFRDAVRFDKGRRLLAGLLHAEDMSHVMVVDDDDFVSSRLVSFVAKNPAANGWYVHDGYVWGSGGRLIYKYADFSMYCGTSHIIRADLYNLPASVESADPAYIRNMLGSHIFIGRHLAANGTPLAPLPFMGAMYRIGHANAHSKSPALLKQFFLKRELVKRPRELARRILRLRLLDRDAKREFWGETG
jgi:hypothetical protein